MSNFTWSNLKTNKCPQCGSAIKPEGLLAMNYLCTKCPFKIGHEKYDAIMADRFRPRSTTRSKSEDERLSELNNDGLEVVSEDFSDSPFADRITK